MKNLASKKNNPWTGYRMLYHSFRILIAVAAGELRPSLNAVIESAITMNREDISFDSHFFGANLGGLIQSGPLYQITIFIL